MAHELVKHPARSLHMTASATCQDLCSRKQKVPSSQLPGPTPSSSIPSLAASACSLESADHPIKEVAAGSALCCRRMNMQQQCVPAVFSMDCALVFLGKGWPAHTMVARHSPDSQLLRQTEYSVGACRIPPRQMSVLKEPLLGNGWEHRHALWLRKSHVDSLRRP